MKNDNKTIFAHYKPTHTHLQCLVQLYKYDKILIYGNDQQDANV